MTLTGLLATKRSKTWPSNMRSILGESPIPKSCYNLQNPSATLEGLEGQPTDIGHFLVTGTEKTRFDPNPHPMPLACGSVLDTTNSRKPEKTTVRLNQLVLEAPVARVGQIFIIGNKKTRDATILNQLSLFPGQLLVTADLRKEEENLVRLNRFVVKPANGIRPTVTVLDSPKDPMSLCKDILITVEEDSSTPDDPNSNGIFSFRTGYSR